MTNRERLFVYGLLAVLLTFNVALVIDHVPGNPAMAQDSQPAVTLGPADSVTLTESEQSDLVVRSREGRLSWSEEETDRAYSTGYVFLGRIMRELMQREEIEEERTALREALGEEEREWQAQLQAIEARGQGLDPESQEIAALYEEWQRVGEQFQRWQQEALARGGKLESEYLETAYRELVEAVNVVAERRSIDIVYQFTPTGEPFEAENPAQAMSTIRMRIAMRYPEGLDITDYVIEEMGLDVD